MDITNPHSSLLIPHLSAILPVPKPYVMYACMHNINKVFKYFSQYILELMAYELAYELKAYGKYILYLLQFFQEIYGIKLFFLNYFFCISMK